MPFISQSQIASPLRAQSEREYKTQLRAALLIPNLTAEQRREIQARLSRVGQVRVYDKDAPPIPGAITFPIPT